MNLLNYTSMLRDKINFYNKYAQNNFESNYNNPFLKKDDLNITIIWVQEDDSAVK